MKCDGDKDSEIARLKIRLAEAEMKNRNLLEIEASLESKSKFWEARFNACQLEIASLKEDERVWLDKLSIEQDKAYELENKVASLKEQHEILCKTILDTKNAEIASLKELVDGASVIVELYKAEYPAQIEWKKSWLKRAKEML